MRHASLLRVTAAMLLTGGAALLAQDYAGPEPAPLPPPIAAPADKPYPGTIALLADCTDTAHRIVDVHETIPVSGALVTLLYPQWIPGNHSPTGPIAKLGGLEITAGGRTLPWVRDAVNVYAFHVPLPPRTSSIAVHYQYLAPLAANQGRISFDDTMIDLSWSTVVLYPAGYFSRRIEFSPAVRLPAGWQYATALHAGAASGGEVRFDNVPLNTLVDSPLYAGAYYRRIDLSTGPSNQVFLNVFGDAPADLAITPEELTLHRNLVQEAQRLFASHHYQQYNFLLMLSDTIGGEGLEHHQSSEDATRANYFTDWDAGLVSRDLLAHEYTHSWNGKFRRPYDLWTPNFNVPMQDDLLWVYEGLTQYWGYVLTARSGMRTAADTRDLIARYVSIFDDSAGRDWRPVLDTTNQPTMAQRAPEPWASWMRGEDYYTEGLLIWLDADTKIRQLSHGRKSLDDFARGFYGIDDGSFVTRTYTFNDLVTALNKVQPYDWATFFTDRIDKVQPHPPEDGITDGGYKMVYNDQMPGWMTIGTANAGDFSTSLGFRVAPNGSISTVQWDSPAFQAGLAPNVRLERVGDASFTVAALHDAVVAAEAGTAPIELTVLRNGTPAKIAIDYHGGLRYPHLERVPGAPDLLDDILQP